jgi:hypothetical protein
VPLITLMPTAAMRTIGFIFPRPAKLIFPMGPICGSHSRSSRSQP